MCVCAKCIVERKKKNTVREIESCARKRVLSKATVIFLFAYFVGSMKNANYYSAAAEDGINTGK